MGVRRGLAPIFVAAALVWAGSALAQSPTDRAPAARSPAVAASVPTAVVTARGETAPVGTANADAADDPAIWRNPADPLASLIVGTDKKAGLYVYGLDGAVRHRVPDGLLNNVALVTLDDGRVIVAASDRSDRRNSAVRLYRLDTVAARLELLGSVPSGRGQGYGLCIDPVTNGTTIQVFAALKRGDVRQLQIRLDPGKVPVGKLVRAFKLRSQIEGCVVDGRSRSLFVGEEDVGIWRFGADALAPRRGWLVARTDGRMLVADVEGLALVQDGPRTLLVASSQGDSAYALYAVPDVRSAPLTPLGRFRIVGGALGAASETDGIELVLGDFGPDYPGGLFVAQDGDNAPHAQNFKLVAWDDIRRALRL